MMPSKIVSVAIAGKAYDVRGAEVPLAPLFKPPSHIRVHSVEIFEQALDAMGVCKHERRGLARVGAWKGLALVEDDTVPRNRAVVMAGESVAYVLKLPVPS